MLRNRESRGSVIALIAVVAFVLAMLVVACLQLSLFLGAGREMRNTADAGALSVGQEVFTAGSVRVTLQPGNQTQFNDVLDKDGKVGLGNINEVWAKALLAEANADAMQTQGNAGSAKAHADAMFDAAKQISDEVATRLDTAANLYPLFDQIAQQNSLRMLGVSTSCKAYQDPKNWQTSLMDRGQESNIEVTASTILPSATAYQALSVTNNHLPGYTPISVGGRTFCFIPFVSKERTHLVSGSEFAANTSSNKALNGPEWGTAVPNAFSCVGDSVHQATYGMSAMAFVMANPQQTFKLSMPHSFIHIKVDNNQTHWYFYPAGPPPLPSVEFGLPQAYGYTTAPQSGEPMPGGGALCSTVTPSGVTVGLDVVGRNLDQIIFGPPNGDTSQLEAALVNRLNEMISTPGMTKTASDLHTVLGNPATIAWLVAGEQDFYLFSPDGQNLTVQPRTLAITQAPWLAAIIDHDPDGVEVASVDDASLPAPYEFTPIVTPDPSCSPAVQLGTETWNKSDYWTPGSGYDGCLGQLRVSRWTNVYSLGVCAPT